MTLTKLLPDVKKLSASEKLKLIRILAQELDIDQLETLAGIERDFEELNTGKTRPIGDFLREMQQKYDISG